MQSNDHTYLIKYRPADQLFAEVEDELRKWNKNGLIDRSNLIKTIQGCNAELGLKINQNKEILIDIKDYHGDLPSDFHKFNYGFLATSFQYSYTEEFSQREVEEVSTLPLNVQAKIEACHVQKICCKDFVLTERKKHRTATITTAEPVCLKATTRSLVDENCPNWYFDTLNEIRISGEQVETNFKSGTLYFNYTGLLESDDGDLLILDHPLTDKYYEAALKFKIFDLLEDNLEGTEVSALRSKWEARHAREKMKADGIINTSEYQQIGKIWERHRRRIYNRYYKMVA